MDDLYRIKRLSDGLLVSSYRHGEVEFGGNVQLLNEEGVKDALSNLCVVANTKEEIRESFLKCPELIETIEYTQDKSMLSLYIVEKVSISIEVKSVINIEEFEIYDMKCTIEL